MTASIWAEVQSERDRAHAKHGDTSMEALPVDDLTRLTVLMEEVGEVARWFNEARSRDMQNGELRAELIQVAAMAGAWADALTYRPVIA
jgi:NTP pyrophosphatase (non-canonical NTP hydrolase)